MPWLAGTALLHSLAVSEKRATFKSLDSAAGAVGVFLSLLGTFLVRSGVLVSRPVRSPPTRPRVSSSLGFLLAVIGSSLAAVRLQGLTR